MNTCSVCGNLYDKTMTIEVNGRIGVFDCFACAIHAMAPHCAICDSRIIGHGMEASGRFYCCSHCARAGGEFALTDRV